MSLNKRLSKKELLMRSLFSVLGSRLKSCNIIFDKKSNFIDLVSAVCGLTNENFTEPNSVYGIGSIKYSGIEWFNGSCFIGYKSDSSGLVRFTDSTGQELLTKLFLSPDILPYFSSIKVSRVDFYVVVETPVIFKNIQDFMLLANEASNMPQPRKNAPIIYTNKQRLIIGKPSGTRSISIEPLGVSNSGTFPKIVVEGALTGKAAMEFALMLTSNSAGFEEYAGYNVYDLFQKISQNAITDALTTALTRMFSLGKVYLPVPPDLVKSATPKGLRPVKSACTTILKRIVEPHLSVKVQKELLQNLIAPLIKNKTLISNYDDFEAKLLLEFGIPLEIEKKVSAVSETVDALTEEEPK